MLKEEPQKRPNIYEVLREACHMRGKEVPIRDVSSFTYSQLCIALFLTRSRLLFF